MKIHKISSFNPIKLLRLLPTATLILLLAGFGLTIYFLYQYFYQTIAQVKIVNILKSQVALNQVNLPLYDKVVNAWENKKQFNVSSLDNINDPFRPVPPTSQTTINEPTIEEVNLIE